jgi:leucyl-tRNA synthetase
MKRATAKGRDNLESTLRNFLELQLRLLAPFAPFTAEEAWERLGNKQSLIETGWPTIQEEKIDPIAEECEFFISSLLADLENIIKVTKISPTMITIYTSSGWKLKVYQLILANILNGKTNFSEIMKQLIANPETSAAKTDPRMVQKMMEDVLSTPLEARHRRLKFLDFDQISAIQDAASLLSTEINKAQIVVYSEEDPEKQDPKSKAKSARPFKPAIYML